MADNEGNFCEEGVVGATTRRGGQPSSTIQMGFQHCIKETTLCRRSQPRTIVRNQAAYITKFLPSRKVSELFRSVSHKINSSRTQGAKELGEGFFREEAGPAGELPKGIVSTLYRQNINNYNPFVATLQALEEEGGMGVREKERVAKLCHIGAAKEFLKTKKYAQGPRYSRVNVQIRPYMREKMHEEVKQRQLNYENVVFIPTNELALSFNPLHSPSELQDLLTPEQFRTIILQVNGLIEQQYISYKSSSMHMFGESLLARVTGVLIGLLTLLLFLRPAKEMLVVLFALILLWILLSIHECGNKLDKLVRSKNVTNTIQEKIRNFFREVSTEQIEWRVGQDFYWLEVHFIKRKIRPNQ